MECPRKLRYSCGSSCKQMRCASLTRLPNRQHDFMDVPALQHPATVSASLVVAEVANVPNDLRD